MKNFEDFKFRDFYCKFSKENNNKIQLDVFINLNNSFVKVNTLFVENRNINNSKKIIENEMCKEIGHISEDGRIEKEYFRQGYIYKNYENFYRRQGICYVSEYDGDTIEDGGISYNGIYDNVCDYLIFNGVDIRKVPIGKIEQMIEDVFEQVDWQYTTSLIDGDDYLEGYVKEFPKGYYINNKKEESNKNSHIEGNEEKEI